MMTVLATREGLVGQRTASGYVIDRVVPFVALPSHAALGRFLLVVNPQTDLSCYAIVLDVGPWNTEDEAYVFEGARPQAESGLDRRGRTTNGAGIDLGERVWSLLRMRDNGPVRWVFLSGPGNLRNQPVGGQPVLIGGPAAATAPAAPAAIPIAGSAAAIDY